MSRYRRDLEAARGRLATREQYSIQTPYGSVQYAERGQGPPLLFSHPLVGGFDVGLGCAEQVPVLLHAGAAPRAVDDDGRVARHRRDHAAGERTRVVEQPGVALQRAAAVRARTRQRHTGTGGREDA